MLKICWANLWHLIWPPLRFGINGLLGAHKMRRCGSGSNRGFRCVHLTSSAGCIKRFHLRKLNSYMPDFRLFFVLKTDGKIIYCFLHRYADCHFRELKFVQGTNKVFYFLYSLTRYYFFFRGLLRIYRSFFSCIFLACFILKVFRLIQLFLKKINFLLTVCTAVQAR